MGHLKSFGRGLVGLFKSHPILTSLFLVFFVAFAGGFVVNLYSKLRGLPGGDKLPAPKVGAVA
jgi:hypothetical protein